MRWTKVRKLVHDSFADSVRGRVKVNITNLPRAPHSRSRQGWITVDGMTVAHAGTQTVTLSLPIAHETQPPQVVTLDNIPWDPMFGELQNSCWQYLQSSLNDSLRSSDPFVSSLAVLNGKVGRTRLRRALTWELHPLTRAMLNFRLEAEAQS